MHNSPQLTQYLGAVEAKLAQDRQAMVSLPLVKKLSDSQGAYLDLAKALVRRFHARTFNVRSETHTLVLWR